MFGIRKARVEALVTKIIIIYVLHFIVFKIINKKLIIVEKGNSKILKSRFINKGSPLEAQV